MSTSERFVLGLDLDGTCADFFGRMREIAAEWTATPLDQLTLDVDWRLDSWGIGKEDYPRFHRFAVTQRELGHVRAQTQAVETVLSAPDARLLTRATTGGGRVTVVVSQSRHALVLTTSGLPSLPAAKVYEVWFLAPGRTQRAGLLPSPTAGRTAPLVAHGLAAGDRIGVTVEPAGGTSRPTTTPILVMSLPT